MNNTKKKYALLFSGRSEVRHLNDLEYMYRTLVDKYEYDEGNITVLFYDGSLNYEMEPKPVRNWPRDDTPYRIIVNGIASKSCFEKKINCIKELISKKDTLLIFTSGHGGGPASFDCTDPSTLWSYATGPSIADKYFGEILRDFPVFKTLLVIMTQCHSGGFLPHVINNSRAINTFFSAACPAWRESAAGELSNPFALHWIDRLSESIQVNAYEGHEYAKLNTHPYDRPVMGESSVNCGLMITL